MKTEQYEGIMTVLGQIRDALIEPDAPDAPVPTPAVPVDCGRVLGPIEQRGAHLALMALLRVLDGWIQGAKENHVVLEHRNESRGSECWREFAPDDIRRMVNDTVQELGLPVEFADPEVAEEDKS